MVFKRTDEHNIDPFIAKCTIVLICKVVSFKISSDSIIHVYIVYCKLGPCFFSGKYSLDVNLARIKIYI
jgi:hypothetical protein